MTQSTSPIRITFTGDGSNKTFGYGVRIENAADIELYVDAVLQVGGYTVNGVGDVGGGSVVFSAAPALDAAGLMLIRPDANQGTNFLTGVLDAESVERALDKLTLFAKELRDLSGRALRLADTDPATGPLPLPDLETLKGNLLGFDASTGAPVAASASLPTAAVSAFMTALLLSVDAAAARTLLGVIFGATTGDTVQLEDVGGNPGLPAVDGSQLTNVGGSVIGGAIPYLFATPPSGWLLLNGDTVGSAASTADQKDDGYETLFTSLWDSMADAEAPVVGGRGASAAADWAANKAITLPDARGRMILGAGAGAGLTARTLGETGGAETHQLTAAQSGVPAHTHTYLANTAAVTVDSGSALNNIQRGNASTPTGANTAASAAEAHPIMNPFVALNWIVRAL